MGFFQLLRMLFSSFGLLRQHRKAMDDLRTFTDRRDAIQSYLSAFRVGDYAGALEATESMSKQPAQQHFFRGGALLHLGRLQEAEASLRKSVQLEHASQFLTMTYSLLGQLMLVQKRTDEAMRCFESSLQHAPQRGSSMRDVAETMLLQGRAGEAVDWARRGVREDRLLVETAQSPAAVDAYSLNLSEDLATLAWAVATASQDRGEVDRLVAEAVPMAGISSVSTTSQVHLHAGRAYVALNDPAKGAEHFEAASHIDPRGAYGREAQALAQSVER